MFIGRLCQVGRPADNQVSLGECRFNFRLHGFFDAVQFKCRLKDAIRQLRQAFFRSADSGEGLDIVIPGRYVLVPDRPVDTVTVFQVGFEVDVAPSIALAVPLQ